MPLRSVVPVGQHCAHGDMRTAHLAILDSSQALDEVRHVDEQASELLHLVRIGIYDLLDSVDTGLKSTTKSVIAACSKQSILPDIKKRSTYPLSHQPSAHPSLAADHQPRRHI